MNDHLAAKDVRLLTRSPLNDINKDNRTSWTTEDIFQMFFSLKHFVLHTIDKRGVAKFVWIGEEIVHVLKRQKVLVGIIGDE